MAQSPLFPTAGIPDTGFGPSRVQQSGANSDGMVMTGAGSLSVSGPAVPVLTRSGNGLWALTRTAAGAETFFFRTTLSQILRIGQPYQEGGFGGAGISFTKPPYTKKGVGIIDVFVALQIGVVALTAVSLAARKTVYSAGNAPAVTDLLGGTPLPIRAVTANIFVQTIPVPVNAQQFVVDDFTEVEIELTATMAATGTIAVAGIGAHLGFNFN